MENHEGNELRKYLKRNDLVITKVAKEWGMSRQNLNYHLRKEVLDDDFKRLLKEKMNLSFSKGKINVPRGKTDYIKDEKPIDILISENEIITRLIQVQAEVNVLTEYVINLMISQPDASGAKVIWKNYLRATKKALKDLTNKVSRGGEQENGEASS